MISPNLFQWNLKNVHSWLPLLDAGKPVANWRQPFFNSTWVLSSSISFDGIFFIWFQWASFYFGSYHRFIFFDWVRKYWNFGTLRDWKDTWMSLRIPPEASRNSQDSNIPEYGKQQGNNPAIVKESSRKVKIEKRSTGMTSVERILQESSGAEFPGNPSLKDLEGPWRISKLWGGDLNTTWLSSIFFLFILFYLQFRTRW